LNDQFKDLVWDVLVRALITKLLAAVPWLVGPLGGIAGLIIGLVGDMLYNLITQYIEFSSIAIRNLEHRRAFDAASVKLKILARDKGIDSEEFKKARDEQRKALSAFVRFN
jgi:hypothetical protein